MRTFQGELNLRLPNKYGCVRHLSGTRRRPWAVVLTTGWTDEGKQTRKYLGYYATKKDAIAALAAYHESPFDLAKKDISFADIYKAWQNTRKDGGKKYSAAYAKLADIHSMPFRDIRKRHIQAVIDNTPLKRSSLANMKTLCTMLYKYAIDQELVTTNYASFVALPPAEQSDKHQPFTDAEIKSLWEHTDLQEVQIALVLIYTGMRPGELLRLDPSTINLEERTMRGGIKTAASIDRIIPIAKKIVPIIKALDFAALPSNTVGINRQWKKSIPALQRHLPHDGRHTCATLLDNADTNLKIRQLILGHSSGDITNRVYTHKTIEQILEAIDKI